MRFPAKPRAIFIILIMVVETVLYKTKVTLIHWILKGSIEFVIVSTNIELFAQTFEDISRNTPKVTTFLSYPETSFMIKKVKLVKRESLLNKREQDYRR